MTTKTKQASMRGLVLRKLADKTGERLPGGAWPLAGVRLEEAPDRTTITTQLLDQGISEGWLSVENDRVVVRPGGEPGNEWRTDRVHTFRHADSVTFKTVDGDVTYRVLHQPDKYADPGDDNTKVTPEIYEAGATRVDHFYVIEKEA